MTTTADDTMTGTAGTNLQSHTPDSGGGTWTKATGTTANATLDGSGHCYDNGFNGPVYYNSKTPASADYDIQVDSKSDASGSYAPGPIGRQSSSADTCYLVFFHGAIGDWLLYKHVAGTATNIGNYTGDVPTTLKSTLLSLSGNSQVFKIGGVTRITTSDTAVTATGFAGACIIGSNANCYVDYWALIEAGGSFTAKFRKTLSGLGSRVGQRQLQS